MWPRVDIAIVEKSIKSDKLYQQNNFNIYGTTYPVTIDEYSKCIYNVYQD